MNSLRINLLLLLVSKVSVEKPFLVFKIKKLYR